ncbi:MAG: Ig-like domain-containing protein [Spirochaetia bacterium]|nr:Ig-like domain-containing protein [Spirochaetia bacterium]
MKKLLKCMVMAVASIGLAFTGCKIDDGGSTPVFWPIGGSGSSSVVAPEIDYDNSSLPEEVIYIQDAKSPKLMVQLANEDKGEWVYKWYKDGYLIEGVDTFVCLPDTSAAAAGGEFYYEVEVFNKLSEKVSVKSKKVKVLVQKAVNPAETNAAEVSISGVSNEGVTYTAGNTANPFKVSYSISKDSTHLEGDVSVKWFDENGVNVGNGDSYTPDVRANVEGVKVYRYKVVVTNSCPDATGADKIKKAEKEVTITVKSADMPVGSIFAAPIRIESNGITGKMEYVAGETASKLTVSSVVTEGENGKKGKVTYKWYTSKDGSAVATGVEYTPDISKYSSVSANTAVSIWVEAINDCSDKATTEPKIQSSGKIEVKITVKPQATTPVLEDGQSKDGNYSMNETAAVLMVRASANGTLSYQWYKNSEKSITGATAISGATSDSYVPSTTTVGVTYYYCKVTNTLNGTTKTNNSGIATVTVKKVIATPVSVVISNKTENAITTGNTKKYSVTVTLSDGTKVNNATWESDNSSIVSVNNDGNVTALKAGTATITATYTAGGVEKNDSVSITVTDAPVGNGNAGISIDFN